MHPYHLPHKGRSAIQLLLLGLFLVAALNYQSILDQYALATFHPPADVAAIESHLDLTQKARATLYRSAPQIDDKPTFNRDCETQPNETELGCYYRNHIYVMKIDNDPLVPEMDVVMAHELLHAVWSNMSPDERKSIGAELERAYAQKADDTLRKRMDGYAKSEPGEQDNELHSILGTEYAGLSPILEAHYAKYFASRGAIVSAHQAYQGVLNTRYNELESQLADIRSKKAQLGLLNRQLDAEKNKGQIDAYNALVPRQNGLVDKINVEISAYNQGKDEYNALVKSLDSQVITDTETSAQ